MCLNQYSACLTPSSCFKDSLVDGITYWSSNSYLKCSETEVFGFWFLISSFVFRFCSIYIYLMYCLQDGIQVQTHTLFIPIFIVWRYLYTIFMHLCFDCNLSHKVRHHIFHAWYNIGTQEVSCYQSTPSPGAPNQEHSLWTPISFWIFDR